jgi:hypothetical protein
VVRSDNRGMPRSAHDYGRAQCGLMAPPVSSHARATRASEALICEQIAAEKLAVWNGDLKLNHSAIRAARTERVARKELPLDEIIRQIRRDEQELRAMQAVDIARRAPDIADEADPVGAPLGLGATKIMLRGSKVIRRLPRSRRAPAGRSRSIRLL